MQCFRVGYRGICHASLVFSVYTRIFGRKSSEVFGSFRKISENFGNGSKVIFRCFYGFLKFSENLRKCSEIFGKFPDVIGNVQ